MKTRLILIFNILFLIQVHADVPEILSYQSQTCTNFRENPDQEVTCFNDLDLAVGGNPINEGFTENIVRVSTLEELADQFRNRIVSEITQNYFQTVLSSAGLGVGSEYLRSQQTQILDSACSQNIPNFQRDFQDISTQYISQIQTLERGRNFQEQKDNYRKKVMHAFLEHSRIRSYINYANSQNISVPSETIEQLESVLLRLELFFPILTQVNNRGLRGSNYADSMMERLTSTIPGFREALPSQEVHRTHPNIQDLLFNNLSEFSLQADFGIETQLPALIPRGFSQRSRERATTNWNRGIGLFEAAHSHIDSGQYRDHFIESNIDSMTTEILDRYQEAFHQVCNADACEIFNYEPERISYIAETMRPNDPLKTYFEKAICDCEIGKREEMSSGLVQLGLLAGGVGILAGCIAFPPACLALGLAYGAVSLPISLHDQQASEFNLAMEQYYSNVGFSMNNSYSQSFENTRSDLQSAYETHAMNNAMVMAEAGFVFADLAAGARWLASLDGVTERSLSRMQDIFYRWRGRERRLAPRRFDQALRDSIDELEESMGPAIRQRNMDQFYPEMNLDPSDSTFLSGLIQDMRRSGRSTSEIQERVTDTINKCIRGGE